MIVLPFPFISLFVACVEGQAAFSNCQYVIKEQEDSSKARDALPISPGPQHPLHADSFSS